jgi:hypothetical protein
MPASPTTTVAEVARFAKKLVQVPKEIDETAEVWKQKRGRKS